MPPVSFGREVLSVALKVVAVVVTVVILFASLYILSLGVTSISDGECNIAVMPIEGTIMPFGNGYQYEEFATTPKDVREFIDAAEAEYLVEAVVFEINSPGGTPVASEAIASEIANLTLPNVALVGDMAASGGYMIAAAADTIVASPMSDVGSIGVTMSYLEESQKNEEEGITYVPLNSAEFKDIGSPYKAITEEEKTLLEGQLKEVHDYFVELVSRYREIDKEKVAELATGATFTGQTALEKGLVDKLGGREEVRGILAEKLGKAPEEIIFCEYTPLDLL